MYPQTVVPSGNELHTTLTNGMDVENSEVTFTRDYYTANKDATAWSEGMYEENKVYEYNNERYVRVTPWAAIDDVTHRYNYSTAENPDPIGQTVVGDAVHIRWFKVEPIKWIILNFNQLIVKDDNDIVTDLPILNKDIPMELYATDVLIGGLAFNSEGNTLWANSDINTYLNSRFYDEAFSLSEADMIQISTIYNNSTNGELTEQTGLNSNYNSLIDGGSGHNPTTQKIYLLSHYEMTGQNSPFINNKIFASGANNSTLRLTKGTDYARAHCLWISSNTYTVYWTRTANDTTLVYRVRNTGELYNDTATRTLNGTRPALTIVGFAL